MKYHYNSEPHTIWIKVAELEFDSRVNRDVKKAWVLELVNKFDPDLFGIVSVSIRSDDTKIVIDGQHRVLAMREMGWGDQAVECKVYRRLTIADEARLFTQLQNRRPVNTIELFIKKETAGDPEVVDIMRVVRGQGLHVSSGGTTPGTVTAVSALTAVYRGGSSRFDQAHPKLLETVLKVCIEAWGLDSANFNGKVLEGIGLLLARYGPTIDKMRLTAKLAGLPGGPHGLLGRARMAKDAHSTNMPRSVAGVLVDLYNGGTNERSKARVKSWW